MKMVRVLYIARMRKRINKSSLFRDFTQPRLVVCYERCGITDLSQLQETAWTFKREPIDRPATSVTNYHFRLRKIPEECRSQRLCSVKSSSEPTIKSCFKFEGLTNGWLKTSCLNLLKNAVDVARNVTSDNVIMADDGIERMRTEGFESRFKMHFGHFGVGELSVADRSFRGVLTAVVFLCVFSKPRRWNFGSVGTVGKLIKITFDHT
jgi:hypothetical protein